MADQLRALYPDVAVALRHVVTEGDRVVDTPLPALGGKGVFTAELEVALLRREIDLAVHSLKDLPITMSSDFAIGAVPERGSPYDALVTRDGGDLAALTRGATVGTSSLRRTAQLMAARPDLQVVPLRGNVPTRLAKLRDPAEPLDAIVLAEAGLRRLGLDGDIAQVLPAEVMLPAPAQGALAVQCRSGDEATRALLAALDHAPTRRATEAERAFLERLDAGCHLPVAALAALDGETLALTGRVCSPDGARVITVHGSAPAHRATHLGHELATQALHRGAAELLAAGVGAAT